MVIIDFVKDYLDRIGITGQVSVDLESLSLLQRAHLSTVPFENIAVWRKEPVATSIEWSIPKVVERKQGGWCFELNGAFAALLESLGFTVRRLGAAVLLGGPNKTVDHLALEVQLDVPYLVDVGFGESFIKPLRINDRDPQDGGAGWFQFMDSAQGLTLTKFDGPPETGVSVPQYRFRRVAHKMEDFVEASDRLRGDPSLHWSNKPFATRLIEGGPQRVTLLRDRIKYHGDGETSETLVAEEDWEQTLQRLFR